MRKQSKYRPKRVVDPLSFVINGLRPATSAKDEILSLKTKNQMAVALLYKGEATKATMDTIITAFNIADGLMCVGIGDEYRDELKKAQDALYAVCCRGHEKERFIGRAEELNAISLGMEIHDQQLSICTVGELDKATKIYRNKLKSGVLRKVA